MNLSYNSFSFSASSDTFFCIIWSMVTTLRIGFALAEAVVSTLVSKMET